MLYNCCKSCKIQRSLDNHAQCVRSHNHLDSVKGSSPDLNPLMYLFTPCNPNELQQLNRCKLGVEIDTQQSNKCRFVWMVVAKTSQICDEVDKQVCLQCKIKFREGFPCIDTRGRLYFKATEACLWLNFFWKMQQSTKSRLV